MKNNLCKMIIYVIQLFDDKFYIGRTNNLNRRLEEHKNGTGAEWTKKYTFIKLLKTVNTNDLFTEDKYVKMYMNKYGINNVRGGSYSNIKLNKEQENLLKKELNTINNNCYRCGRNSHYIKNCYAKTDINGNDLTNKKLDNNDLNNKKLDNNDLTNKKLDNNDLTNKKLESNDLNIYQDIVSSLKSIYRYFKY